MDAFSGQKHHSVVESQRDRTCIFQQVHHSTVEIKREQTCLLFKCSASAVIRTSEFRFQLIFFFFGEFALISNPIMAGAVARGTFDDKIKFRCNNCLIHYPIFPEDEQPTPTTTGGSSNRSTPKMFIFNCYHVCCQQCRVQFDGKCPVCRHDATCLEINRKMPRYVQAYFDPIRKSIDQLLSVVHFQKYQDDLVTKRLIGQYEMYKKRREEEEAKYHRLREELKEDKLKLDKLRVIKQIIIDEKQ